MICNKCGKNNAPGAEICSLCKEPMPSITACGGFSDILTYTPPTASDAQPAPAPMPMPTVPRQVVETHQDEPWYADILSKKNIISLAAIFLCIITLAVVMISSCSSPDEDSAGSSPDATQQGDGTEEEPQTYTVASKKSGIPAPAFSKSVTEVEITVKDSKDKSVDAVICDSDGKEIKKSIVSQKAFEAGILIEMTVSEDQFPLYLYYDDEKQDGVLKLEKGKLVWEKAIVSSSGNNETKVPEWVTKPVSGKEKRCIFYSDDLAFPSGAKTAKLIVKGGNSKNIDTKRVFVVSLDGEDIKTDGDIYTKEEFENIAMIIINAKADKELDNSNTVKTPEFKKES